MLRRISKAYSAASRIKKYALAISIFSISCIDFEFESEYEDINGIYLEQIASYDIHGEKIIVDDGIGYIINEDSLLIYDFENVYSISLLSTYDVPGTIRDFAIDGGYAYLTRSSFLEVIDLSGSTPQQSALLYISDPHEIKVRDDHAYLLSGFYETSRLNIINITDKTNPFLIDSISFNDRIFQVEIDSNFAYVLGDYGFHIVDLREPNFPVYTFLRDTISIASFTLDGQYLHISGWHYATATSELITCTLSDNHELTRISDIIFPTLCDPLETDGHYGLGLPGWRYVYLFELIDHARVYIAEELCVTGTPRSGSIKGNYIYVLSPLNIVEIKQVAQ